LLAVVAISDEEAIPFTSFILLDNFVEVCDENAGEAENPKISVRDL